VRQTFIKIFFIILLAWIPLFPAVAQKIAVIKSKNLAPYEEAVKSFRENSSFEIIAEISIEGDAESGKKSVEKILSYHPDLLYAVGPEAAYASVKTAGNLPVLYAMVSNPSKLGISGEHVYGIDLTISNELQIHEIKKVFPDVRKIGIIHDPSYSNISDMVSRAKESGLEVVPVPVSKGSEIPDTFKSSKDRFDILWMIPDKTVTTKGSITYLMENALFSGIPVVGFNRWFAENGASLSFEVDYQAIGIQSVKIAKMILEKEPSLKQGSFLPEKIIRNINLKVLKKIGVNFFIDSKDPDVRIIE
jgi:putative ABC transport system substrate-binding protein